MILSITPQTQSIPVSSKHPDRRLVPSPRAERKSIVIDVWVVDYTGEIPTVAEVDVFIAAQQAKGDRAEQAVAAMDRIIFEMIFRLENQGRELKSKIKLLLPNTYITAEVTQLNGNQFRQFLVNRWRELNL